MPKAEASLPSALERSVSRDTPIIESRRLSRSCRSLLLCLRRKMGRSSSPSSVLESNCSCCISSGSTCPLSDNVSLFCALDLAIGSTNHAGCPPSVPNKEANIYWQLFCGARGKIRTLGTCAGVTVQGKSPKDSGAKQHQRRSQHQVANQ